MILLQLQLIKVLPWGINPSNHKHRGHWGVNAVAERFVSVSDYAVFRGWLEERQTMEIHLACGGTGPLNMALD